MVDGGTGFTDEYCPARKVETPRFLFRGFNKYSGGNAGLNTKTSITPHAFWGAGADVDPNIIGGKPVRSIPFTALQLEVDFHLSGVPTRSHFSSWTAEFQTAISFAGVGSTASIAVLDTQARDTSGHTEIWHVPALIEAGIAHADLNYTNEYLVYGPVQGRAYTAWVSLPKLKQYVASQDTRHLFFLTTGSCTGHITSTMLDQAHAVASFFRAYDATEGPELYFTVLAAELGRYRVPPIPLPVGADMVSSANEGRPTASDLQRIAESRVGDAIKHAAKTSTSERVVLANPHTYSKGLPQVKCMIDILQYLETEVLKARSNQPQLKRSVPLARPRPKTGRKRAARDSVGHEDLPKAKIIKSSSALSKSMTGAIQKKANLDSVEASTPVPTPLYAPAVFEQAYNDMVQSLSVQLSGLTMHAIRFNFSFASF